MKIVRDFPGVHLEIELTEDEIKAVSKERWESVRQDVTSRPGRKRVTKDNLPVMFLVMMENRTGKINVSEIARACGVSWPTANKYLRLYKEK